MGNRDHDFEHRNRDREADHRKKDRESKHRNRDRDRESEYRSRGEEFEHREGDREFQHRGRDREFVQPIPEREREREYRHRDDDRERHSKSKRRRDEMDEDWRNVRVKDEPISDSESFRRDRNPSDKYANQSSSNRSRAEPDRERNRIHQPHHEQGSRSRSRNRDGDRFFRPPPPPSRKNDASSPQRHEGSRHVPDRHVNNRSEQLPPRERDKDRERDRDRDGESSRQNNRRRDTGNRFGGGPTERPAREKDWDNFFNPNTKVKVEDEDSKYGKKGPDGNEEPKVEKEKPNFGLSGKLTEETNTYRGVVIKYSEPPEARKPQRIRWRLYPFKGSETLPTMYIHRQSAYLLGRERKIADIPIDHPSCSKQHAVIQYRLMPYQRSNGTRGRRIKPYIIDLESGNGTFVNGKQIETKRYVELFEKDVLKFGFSSREYVLLHEHSKDEPDDDEPMGNSPEVDDKVRIKAERLEEDD